MPAAGFTPPIWTLTPEEGEHQGALLLRTISQGAEGIYFDLSDSALIKRRTEEVWTGKGSLWSPT